MPLEHKLVAGTHAFVASLLLAGIWLALPARHLPVDVIATGVAVAAFVSSASLCLRRAWAPRLARGVCWILLAAGCATTSALAWSAAHLAGSYGPVGLC